MTIREQQRAVKMFRPNKFPTRCILLFAFSASSLAATWQTTVSREPAGNFPELRPLRASYHFGWSGLTAATGEVHFTKPSKDKFQFDGTGRTIGLVRVLWKLDVNHRAAASAETLHPIETEQTENYHWKKIITHLAFYAGWPAAMTAALVAKDVFEKR